ALAGALAARGFRLALVTDDRGARYGGELGRIDIHRLPLKKMTGGIVRKLVGALSLIPGYFAARALIAKLAPDAVVGFGGYPSLPTVAAASTAKVPTILHEQNAVLGRANRLIAGRVDAIAGSFAKTRGAERAAHVGNPVRVAAIGLRATTYIVPASGGELRLLVTGGSQGASIFGRVVPEAVAQLAPEPRARLRIVQQTREDDVERVRAAYAQLGVAAEVAPFFADLPARIAAAQLVVARAGASTVAELACIGRPSILVPYPHATDDHQTANAKALEAAGGAWVVADKEFTAADLAARLTALLAEPSALSRMAQSSWGFGKPDAAERLADLVAGFAQGRAA
ncbi:MAG: UDP-N-acetylglucosamine--N-acetylmuramyl-(pentapeptide) pyrophosphoryl-undecaprenol N-acetylglucosamine transferase, partial [Tagaea sp.]|nr:UDP-N-acetylglucosamine--N-acetylmuramyl-(pentapeptide) pyrophosphoryl-undecaprenol N-acetylglucosamine transferase [Tagaea sp.]